MNKQQLPPLPVIDAIDKWIHQQTRFHLSDTDGYQEMLAEVAWAVDQYAYEYAERVIGEDVDEGHYTVDPTERIKQHEAGAINRHLYEQRKTNRELSSHEEEERKD